MKNLGELLQNRCGSLEAFFNIVDSQGKGYFTVEDFAHGIGLLGLKVDDIKGTFSSIDTDSTGIVSLPVFLLAFDAPQSLSSLVVGSEMSMGMMTSALPPIATTTGPSATLDIAGQLASDGAGSPAAPASARDGGTLWARVARLEGLCNSLISSPPFLKQFDRLQEELQAICETRCKQALSDFTQRLDAHRHGTEALVVELLERHHRGSSPVEALEVAHRAVDNSIECQQLVERLEKLCGSFCTMPQVEECIRSHSERLKPERTRNTLGSRSLEELGPWEQEVQAKLLVLERLQEERAATTAAEGFTPLPLRHRSAHIFSRQVSTEDGSVAMPSAPLLGALPDETQVHVAVTSPSRTAGHGKQQARALSPTSQPPPVAMSLPVAGGASMSPPCAWQMRSSSMQPPLPASHMGLSVTAPTSMSSVPEPRETSVPGSGKRRAQALSPKGSASSSMMQGPPEVGTPKVPMKATMRSPPSHSTMRHGHTISVCPASPTGSQGSTVALWTSAMLQRSGSSNMQPGVASSSVASSGNLRAQGSAAAAASVASSAGVAGSTLNTTLTSSSPSVTTPPSNG